MLFINTVTEVLQIFSLRGEHVSEHSVANTSFLNYIQVAGGHFDKIL